jgi:hypothetical protein
MSQHVHCSHLGQVWLCVASRQPAACEQPAHALRFAAVEVTRYNNVALLRGQPSCGLVALQTGQRTAGLRTTAAAAAVDQHNGAGSRLYAVG